MEGNNHILRWGAIPVYYLQEFRKSTKCTNQFIQSPVCCMKQE